jgi:hypothetical protein
MDSRLRGNDAEVLSRFLQCHHDAPSSKAGIAAQLMTQTAQIEASAESLLTRSMGTPS